MHRANNCFIISCIDLTKTICTFSPQPPPPCPLPGFTGATFTDWFTSYVNNVVSGGFPIIRDQIFRYFTWDFRIETIMNQEITISYSL